MTLYKLGDLVRECKDKVDRNNNAYEYFIAGDHMDSDRLKISRRGRFSESDVGPAFVRLFKPGQVLYGSRRTYLKKVAVADFEGVTSNVTFVIETKDEGGFPQRLLPFVLLSDRFTSYSVGKSKGSTNPYVLFSDLEDFEIDLPSIEKQREIASTLWAAENLKEHYRTLMKTSDDLVKSQFIEMFGDPAKPSGRFEMKPMGSFASISSGATPKRDRAEYYGGNIPWVKTTEVAAGDVTKAEETITELGLSSSSCRVIPAGSILVAMYGQGGTRGKASMLKIDAATNQACAAIIPNSSVSTVFLLIQLQICYEDLRSKSRGGNQKNLSLQTLKNYPVIVPPLKDQCDFGDFVAQVDKSKYA